jgi:hypothetical protein
MYVILYKLCILLTTQKLKPMPKKFVIKAGYAAASTIGHGRECDIAS